MYYIKFKVYLSMKKGTLVFVLKLVSYIVAAALGYLGNGTVL